MERVATDRGLIDSYYSRLKYTLQDRIKITSTLLLCNPGFSLPQPEIELTSDAKPVEIRLQKYSQEQKVLVNKFCKRHRTI